MGVPTLDRAQARRIAVRAQLLDAPRPTDLLAVVDQLTFLQIDPTAAVAPSADLVAWSRLGSSYRPAHLREALERDRTLFEHNAMVRPMSDLRLFLPSMAVWPGRERYRQWLAANDPFRRDVLRLLRASGPVLSRELPDTSVEPWPSSGWTNNRNVTQMLEFLMMRGEVAIAGRRGRQRLWDLAERVYPTDTPAIPLVEARRLRAERQLRSLGIVRETAAGSPSEPLAVGRAGENTSRPTTWEAGGRNRHGLYEPNVTVTSARTCGPATSPVSGSTPLGRSTATTGDVGVCPNIALHTALYGPFKRLMATDPGRGHRRGLQLDAGRADRDALTQAETWLSEGADSLTVQPALTAVDVLVRLRGHTRLPLIAYSTSGEYAALTALGEAGLVEYHACLKRAGADLILSFAAEQVARTLP